MQERHWRSWFVQLTWMSPKLHQALQKVRDHGFSTVAVGSPEAAQSLASDIGKVLLCTEVRLNARVATYLCQPDAIPPHTDHPAARYILWYCRMPGNVTNRLVDARKVLDSIPQEERAALEKLRFVCAPTDNYHRTERCTLWDDRHGRIFFAAWCAHPADVGLAQSAETLFGRASHAQHAIKLNAGEALLVDNHRMLHFRDAMAADSTRWLTRWWIGNRKSSLAIP